MSVKHIHSSTTPPYKTLLALDKKIRQFPVPEHLVAPVSISTGVLDTMPSGATGSPGGLSWSTDARHAMQQYAALCIKECSAYSSEIIKYSLKNVDTVDLMYLHRVYFYNALRTAGPNLLDHRFIVSVLATYRSARRLLSSMQSLYSVHPVPASRCWFFWTAYFSACVCGYLFLGVEVLANKPTLQFVLGIMVAKRPKSPFAAEAMQELTGAIPFYDRGSETCRPPHTLVRGLILCNLLLTDIAQLRQRLIRCLPTHLRFTEARYQQLFCASIMTTSWISLVARASSYSP